MKVDVPTVTRSAEMCEGLYCWNSASVALGVYAQEDEPLSFWQKYRQVSALPAWVMPCKSVTSVPAVPGVVGARRPRKQNKAWPAKSMVLSHAQPRGCGREHILLAAQFTEI